MEQNKQKTADELRKLLFTQSDSMKALNQTGKLTAYQRVNAIFDEGTFVEIGTFVKRNTTEFDESAGNELEGVVTGYGAVDGRLVFAFAQDFSRMKGAIGEMHARKICNLYDLAMKNGAPMIGIFDSAGAKVLEGVSALAGYGKIMKKAASASGIIPQIAIIAGICAGSAAAIAGIFDFVIGIKKNGQFYVNSPFLLAAEKKDTAFGTIVAADKNGLLHFISETEEEGYALTRKLLNYLPSNNTEGTVYAMPSDEINRLTPELKNILLSEKYDMKAVLSGISDDAAFFEISASYAPELLTGFIQLNGMVLGVCANQPAVKEGMLTPSAATKAARWISFCDCMQIPLLTLTDTVGFEITEASENAPYATELAKLACAYASSVNTKVTVVVGKAYGSAYTLMGSKALGADLAFAVDSAKISALPPQASVQFIWEDKLKEAKNPQKTKQDLEAEWAYTLASPLEAAKNGEIDDIISYEELRQRTAAAFEMLSVKNEGLLTKKHSNFPL